MDARTAETGIPTSRIGSAEGTAFAVIGAISFCHCLNDLLQALLPAIYPILKTSYGLDFGQIGLITLVFNLVASVLQPLVGVYTDRRPQPFSLPLGMAITLVGLLLLATASSYALVLVAATLVGLGSAIFHPEASRVARLAAGGRPGTAQSLFQVGGNFGSALGPLLAAFLVVPRGQGSLAWFAVLPMIAIAILSAVGRWYRDRVRSGAGARQRTERTDGLSRTRVLVALGVLVVLIFSKNVYMAVFGSYYTFYLIDRFGLSVGAAQLCLFVFLGSAALGTVLGGPLGDRFGGKVVIWGSILGVLPFTLLLPYVNLGWTVALTIVIGLILSSAMPQMVVFAQELLPGRVGLVSGLSLGLAFGAGGIGAAILGVVADRTSVEFVYQICSVLPAIGLAAAFLPSLNERSRT